MRIGFRAVSVVIATSAIAATLLFGSLKSGVAQSVKRYLPEYTADGQLLLPKNFHEWVYVGSPLTPNALERRPGQLSGISQRLHRAWLVRDLQEDRTSSPRGRSFSRNSS